MPVYEERDRSRWTKDGRKFYFKCPYTDMYGKRKQKKSKMYKSRPAAKKAEDEFLLNVATTDETDLDIMFKDVYKEWFFIKSRTVKETSAHTIKLKIEKNILEFFKDFKLHSIKTNIIYTWYEWLEKKEHNTEYDNVLITYLKEILQYASFNYEFDNKILSKIEKKKNNSIRTIKNDSEINYWTYEEFNQFISNVDDDFYYTVFSFLYFTGLRKGEMFALTWNDIDFTNKKVNINKQIVSKLGKKTYAITSTKTNNSDRIIDLDNNLIDLLLKYYEKQTKLYGFNQNYFVFGSIKPLSSTTLKRYLQKYIDISKIKPISPHGFRHSHASLLIHLGCDSRDVANRLGDTIETIENTYYHMFPEKKKNTINILNNFKNNV